MVKSSNFTIRTVQPCWLDLSLVHNLLDQLQSSRTIWVLRNVFWANLKKSVMFASRDLPRIGIIEKEAAISNYLIMPACAWVSQSLTRVNLVWGPTTDNWMGTAEPASSSRLWAGDLPSPWAGFSSSRSQSTCGENSLIIIGCSLLVSAMANGIWLCDDGIIRVNCFSQWSSKASWWFLTFVYMFPIGDAWLIDWYFGLPSRNVP